MKTLLIAAAFLMTIVSCRAVRDHRKEYPGETGRHSFSWLEKQFREPGKEFRSAPLWVWNTEVSEEIIDSMMYGFKGNAFGGVFIHPRPGLITEYLSAEWFRLVGHTLDKGRELGLDVWIYDENSYPSGFAGGHVPDRMPESYNQGQMLHLTKAAVLPDTAEKFFIVLKGTESGFEDITGKLDAHLGRQGDFYLFGKENYRKSSWYGGFSYVDLMVKGVTEEFIEATMEGYERLAGKEFGELVPGIFTDEPNIEVQGDGNIRWTPDLFDTFREKWGYDLRLHLPSLFEETGDWKRVRHNYYQVLLQLFIDRWSKPWHAYTEKKGLEWTGHYWEHGWPNPNHGGDNMAMYAWHQRPAIDMLFNQFDEESPNAQFGNIRAVKELASVANQLGKKRTLSETYGGGGWELTFRDMKRLGDWEYVLGVNTLNQHLSFMTIKGARKYDYPPSFSYHSPWWPYYGLLNWYFARLSLALSSGRQVNDILVIEPTTSAWMYAAYGKANPEMQELGRKFQSFVTLLERMLVEYDLGSENIIKDHGRVKGGKFIIGERAYSTVVLPPGMENTDSATFALLERYAAEGGKLLSFERLQYIDGGKSGRIAGLYKEAEHLHEPGRLDDQVIGAHFSSPGIRFLQAGGGRLYHQRRELEGGQLLFLVNSAMEETSRGKVRIRGRDAVLMDALSGNVYDYPDQPQNGEVLLEFELPPAGSLLLFIGERPLKGYPPYAAPVTNGKAIETATARALRARPNVLAIDFCDVSLGGSRLENINVYDAADTVFKYHGFESGNPWNTSVQFRRNTVQRDTFPPGSGFTATYRFHIEEGVNLP
ncbi:MAG TPA: glycosyl hydrolase, partial [Anseongella sp.]|nr:glycosyl hydrolase [Anseongella sp.]